MEAEIGKCSDDHPAGRQKMLAWLIRGPRGTRARLEGEMLRNAWDEVKSRGLMGGEGGPDDPGKEGRRQ
eukprot:9233464-Alexandrium_andersonii.AAC.1